MADVHFVFFDKTSGTAAARPVLRSYVEDEADVPDYALLDLDPAAVGHVRLSVFEVPDPDDAGQKPAVTVNAGSVLPTTEAAYAVATRGVQALAAAQGEAQAQLDQLVEDVAWTQRLDASITGASRRAARAYMAALRAAPATYATLWATDPLAIFAATSPVPFPTAPVAIAAATDQGEVLERALNAGNFVDNSRFEDGLAGWLKAGVGAVNAETAMSLRAAGTTWAGARTPTAQLVQTGTSLGGVADFAQVIARNINKDGTTSPMLMPVGGLDWIEFGVHLSTHRCTGAIGIAWFDATGASLAASPFSAFTPVAHNPSSPTNPDEWPVAWTGPVKVPAGAAYAAPVARKYGTLAGASPANSLLIWHKPMLGFAHERQAVPSAYQPESPRFLPRAQAQDGMATDVWEAGRVGYAGAGHAEYSGGMDVVSFTLGNLPEADQFTLSMTARARSQGSGATNVFFQYQVRQDGGAFGAWINLRIWTTGPDLPLQSAYVPLTHIQAITGDFDEIRLRVRFGSGSGTTADIIGRTKVKVRRGVL